MRTLTGIYRAVCLGADPDAGVIRCQVPQIFAEETVTCLDSVGATPKAGDIGWVAFEAGFPDRPVWMSGGNPADDEVFVGPDDPDGQYELWYDTDATPTGGGGGGGTSGPVAYVHNQGTTSATWTVTHGLGWYPNVTVIDSAGTTVEGDVTQVNTNQLTIRFSGAFTGVAYLS